MDSAWFQGQSAEAVLQQSWFMRLGLGESPRSLDLPISLTKRMAHLFLHAPQGYSIDAALRFCQVSALGGSGRLAKAILGSRIATNFDNNEFWQTVIQWFSQHPMLDPALIAPLIDYIYRRKFEPGGFDSDAEPDRTDFTMKGRTPDSMIRQMLEWHAMLRKEPEKTQLEWPASGTRPFEWTEGVLASNDLRRWTIVELVNRQELYHEGRVMRHCVASYERSCLGGGTSIWSLGVERNLGRRRRVLTIELGNVSRRIGQIRGKANRIPSQKEMMIVRRWATQENLTLAAAIAS
jgi:hypothetical protein